MATQSPPFRADHVGSLLRPAAITEARKKHFEDKSITAEDLKAVEDAEIPALIKMQEEVDRISLTFGNGCQVELGAFFERVGKLKVEIERQHGHGYHKDQQET